MRQLILLLLALLFLVLGGLEVVASHRVPLTSRQPPAPTSLSEAE